MCHYELNDIRFPLHVLAILIDCIGWAIFRLSGGSYFNWLCLLRYFLTVQKTMEFGNTRLIYIFKRSWMILIHKLFIYTFCTLYRFFIQGSTIYNGYFGDLFLDGNTISNSSTYSVQCWIPQFPHRMFRLSEISIDQISLPKSTFSLFFLSVVVDYYYFFVSK